MEWLLLINARETEATQTARKAISVELKVSFKLQICLHLNFFFLIEWLRGVEFSQSKLN